MGAAWPVDLLLLLSQLISRRADNLRSVILYGFLLLIAVKVEFGSTYLLESAGLVFVVVAEITPTHHKRLPLYMNDLPTRALAPWAPVTGGREVEM